MHIGIKIDDNNVDCSLSGIGRTKPMPVFDWFKIKSAW